MRRALLSTLAVLAVLSPALALADDYSEFRIPAHRASGLDLSVSTTARSGASAFASSASDSRSWYGRLSSSARWLWDSDPSRTDLQISATGGGSRSSGTYHSFYSDPFGVSANDERSRTRQTDEQWSVNGGRRWYPSARPFGLDLRALVSGIESQQWIRSERDQHAVTTAYDFRSLQNESRARWTYFNRLEASLAAGYGRVRDATSVYEAHVLEERLRESGALARPLSPEGRQRLAAVLALRSGYRATLERPARAIWKEIERVLDSDGALSDEGWSPDALLRAVEPLFGRYGGNDLLPSSPITRERGTFAGLVVSAEDESRISRLDLQQSSSFWDTGVLVTSNTQHVSDSSHEASDVLSGGARIEHHRPLGHRWQFDGESELLLPLQSKYDGLQATTTASVGYIVADRWLATGSILHERVILHESDARTTLLDRWQLAVSANVTYYLEDRLQLSLGASRVEQRSAPSPVSYVDEYDRDFAVAFSLAYNVFGRLEAPGLVEPLSVPPAP